MKIIFLIFCVFLCSGKPVFADKLLDEALFYAAGQGDTAKVQTLLAQGADPSIHNSTSGFSALMAACLFSDDALARVLVEGGADVNQRTIQGESALYYAVARNNTPMALMLLENGADAQIKTLGGDTPCQAARRGNNARLLAALGAAEKKVNLDSYPAVATQTSIALLTEKD